MKNRLFQSCSLSIWISSPESRLQDTRFSHKVLILERYVTTTYRLLDLHMCALG